MVSLEIAFPERYFTCSATSFISLVLLSLLRVWNTFSQSRGFIKVMLNHELKRFGEIIHSYKFRIQRDQTH